MDLLPLVPKNFTNHEVTPSIRAALQTELDGNIYPKDIAENYVQNIHYEEGDYLLENAKSVIDIYVEESKNIRKTQLASVDIMVQQAKYLIEKEKINSSFTLKETIKLKRCDLFKKLEDEFVVEYNLIQSSDLLPDLIRRYLDFRDGSDILCSSCDNKIKTVVDKHQKETEVKTKFQDKTATLVRKYSNSYKVVPCNVIFHNYEVGQIYHKKVKIINTSKYLQAIGLKNLPKLSCFKIMFDNNNKKIAAGMSVTATITFKPEVYRTLKDYVRFKNEFGEFVDIEICATRDVPKLISCVFKSKTHLGQQSETYLRFEERRREALNSTIDCGSCLVSQYVLVSVILENKGMPGKFFFITEDGWFFKDIDDVSSSMELFKSDFWIYPIYFEIEKDEIVEITTIFQPTKPGLHVETLYLMCDNNTYQQIELVGDAIEFSKNLIEIIIPPDKSGIINEEGYTVFLGHVFNKTTASFIINIRNKSFYIMNIPLISLKENEDFIVVEQENISGKTLSEAVDVLCTEIEVCVSIITEEDIPKCLCDQTSASTKPKQRMAFSCPFINFSILPHGLEVQKEFYIRNDSEQTLSWKILEVKYNIDVPPHMEIMKEAQQLSFTYGTCNPWDYKKLYYKIQKKKPMSYVSILVLISLDSDVNTTIEDICIITYEIIKFDIQIKTRETTFPILCPLEIVYKGIPIDIQFVVENHSPIIGFFQFLRPTGEDVDKMVVKLNPSSSAIKPLETITVTATLICTETGLLEDFYIPCFVGLGQEPITIKVLCMVEGPRLTFYLPVNSCYFKKVPWPPTDKDVFDVDVCSCTECPLEEETEENFSRPNFLPEEITERCQKKTTASMSIKNGVETKLEKILKKEFGDVFLHENIIELRNVPVFTPTNVCIFVENITPMRIKCNTGVNNFPVKQNFDHVTIRLRLKKNEEIWKDLMGTNHGILVQPEVDSKKIEPHSIVRLDFWIYANTFGIYTEEVVIEIEELPMYYFSLLIEIVGCPIQVPMALNSITKNPTIRIGAIPFNATEIKRRLKIQNVSSIPVNIFWRSHLRESIEQDFDKNEACDFLLKLTREQDNRKMNEFNLDNCVVKETEQFLDIESKETHMEPYSSSYLDIILKPQYFGEEDENKDVTNEFFGIIQIDLDYMKNSNYYFRQIQPETNIIQLECLTRLETPSLKFDFFGKEEFSLDIYVNDILLKKQYGFKEYGVLMNKSGIGFETKLTVDYPFYFKKCKAKTVQTKEVYLNPYDISELTLQCQFNPDDLLELSYILYQQKTSYPEEYNPKLLKDLDEITTDKEKKIIYITKSLIATQLNNILQLPIKMTLYYPHISVQPSSVEFDNVLINQTYKDMITVFNHTGSIVKFEISKSCEANCFVVTPHFGEIPPSTGTNKQSVNIFVYFFANECKKYSESFRVLTNIPNYFIEIPVKGAGTINERFSTNYKT
ncbi:uncharacterized protein LOC130900858 isoform X2 [Diorhabda carinulata]|uniref:uncharacterized protein LOC130900858 isoform X2 n=1 Tax=Diorhabda carinulata TaxID=1163345 RepID=UPI0025A23359|nr:uncharacterized protein LOC130900858 isoform X2 [Diorhabda carinulata]